MGDIDSRKPPMPATSGADGVSAPIQSPWHLARGDCLDPLTGLATLGDRSVDHVICDPPYSEHVHTKSRSGRKRDRLYESEGARPACSDTRIAVDLGFTHITQERREAIADQAARVVRRWALVFCDDESSHLWRGALTSAGLEYVRTGHWQKIGGTPQFTGDRPGVGTEAIVIAHQPGKKRWNGGGRPALWSCPIVLDRGAGEQRLHTTQKPVDLMLALVRDFTDPGDLILDPFAGSGTTGVAALQTGRRFVGWEQDAKYHAVATSRLVITREQPSLFAEKKRRGKTADLFAAPHPSPTSTDGEPSTEATT